MPHSGYPLAARTQGSGPGAGEQFLTLDHFLNEQGSPPQTVTAPDLSGQMSHRQMSSDITQTMTQVGATESTPSMRNTEKGRGGGQLGIYEAGLHPAQRQRYDVPPSKSPRMASASPLRVDPDEIKRRQINRQQTLEQKRKQEIENLRNQAK